MLKRRLLASAAFTATAFATSSGIAADMPVFKEPAQVPVSPVQTFYDWSGIYAGVHAGYSWEDTSVRYPGFAFPPFVIGDPVSLTIDSEGFNAGIQVGANWQFNQWVLGVEGDWSWSDSDGSTTALAPFSSFLLRAGEDDIPMTFSQDIKWFGTVRGRIGYAVDNFLLYGTGGVAFKRSQVSMSGVISEDDFPLAEDDFPFASSDTNTHIGWTIGFGAEAGVTENISVKAEYLYMDFGSETYALNVDGFPTPTRVDFDQHVVRLGLNWRFGGTTGLRY